MDALGGVFYVSRCGQRTYVARAGARRSNSFTDKDLQLFSKHPQGGVDILPIYSIMGEVFWGGGKLFFDVLSCRRPFLSQLVSPAEGSW